MTVVHRHDLDHLERLGGTTAAVQRAVIRRTGRVVVVKHAPWDSPAAGRLARVAQVLSRAHHPSLVRLEAVIEDEAGRGLVLTNCPGGSLADEVAAGRHWAAHAVADAGARLARALAVLHAAGMVHGDVHPGNVVLDAELQPVLVDLEHTQPIGTTPTSVVGHADHLDHRLLVGAPLTPATDLHALATTLWTLATGTPPDRGRPDAPVELVSHPGVPPQLHTALQRCIQHEVSSAAALATDLDGIAAALSAGRPPAAEPSLPVARPTVHAAATRHWGPPTPPLGPAEGSDPRPRRARVVATLGVLGVALGLGAVLRLATAAPATHDPSELRGQTAAADTTPATAATPATPASRTSSRVDPCAATPGAGTNLRVDVDGDGCAEPVTLTDGVLHTPEASYAFGEPGDVLLVGDWDGDGRVGVGLYRPTTGAVLLVDDPGPGARSAAPHYVDVEATPRIITDGDGARVETT